MIGTNSVLPELMQRLLFYLMKLDILLRTSRRTYDSSVYIMKNKIFKAFLILRNQFWQRVYTKKIAYTQDEMGDQPILAPSHGFV